MPPDITTPNQNSDDRTETMEEVTWGTERVQELVERMLVLINHLRIGLRLDERYNTFKKYARDHPTQTLGLVIMAAMSAIPLLIFATFAFWTTIITFLAFVFVEGTLVTLGVILLTAVLSLSLFVTLLITVVITTVLMMAKTARSAWYEQFTSFIPSEWRQPATEIPTENIPNDKQTKSE